LPDKGSATGLDDLPCFVEVAGLVDLPHFAGAAGLVDLPYFAKVAEHMHLKLVGIDNST
jgi:hypothetical protein